MVTKHTIPPNYYKSITMSDKLYNEIRKYAEDKMTSQELDDMLAQLDHADDESLKPMLHGFWDNQPDINTLDDGLRESIFQKITDAIKADTAVGRVTTGSSYTRLWWMVAAAVALCIIGGGMVWYRQYTKVTPPVITAEVRSAMDRSKSTNLDEVVVTPLEKKTKQVVAVQLSKYCKDEEVVEKLSEATQISTHIDKEGWVRLDDGTVVHLNSGSRIIYPEHFGRGDRDVILDGEAYFMVATDRSRPFVVHTTHGDIREYGTEFNVSARNGSVATEVVLVSGSIGVTPVGRREKMMQPGTLCRMSTTACDISPTDTEPYRAWNTGKIEFHDWTLERIMRIVGRWYNCKIEYADDSLKTERLSGMFDRYDSPATTLQALQTVTGLHFEIAGGIIGIMP